jgi:hypothetical protein
LRQGHPACRAILGIAPWEHHFLSTKMH